MSGANLLKAVFERFLQYLLCCRAVFCRAAITGAAITGAAITGAAIKESN